MTPKLFTPENEHFLTVQKYLIEAYRMVDISRFKVDFLNGGFQSAILVHQGRRIDTEVLGKATGEIFRIIKANFIGNFRNIHGARPTVAHDQFVRCLKTESTEQLTGRLSDKALQFFY